MIIIDNGVITEKEFSEMHLNERDQYNRLSRAKIQLLVENIGQCLYFNDSSDFGSCLRECLSILDESILDDIENKSLSQRSEYILGISG